MRDSFVYNELSINLVNSGVCGDDSKELMEIQ